MRKRYADILIEFKERREKLNAKAPIFIVYYRRAVKIFLMI